MKHIIQISKTTIFRLLFAIGFSVASGFAFGQTCPNLAGGTEFAPSPGHENDYYYSIDNVELNGPMGNFLGTDAKLAEFGYDFDPNNPIHDKDNEDYVPMNEDFIYVVTDTTTKLNPEFAERIGNNFVFTRPDKLQEILSITVTSMKPGTTIKVSGTFEVLTSDLDDGKHKVSYDGGTTYSYMDWNQTGTFTIDVNGDTENGESFQPKYSSPKLAFSMEYELGPNDKVAKISIKTGYNAPNTVDAFAIYNLKVEGCLDPTVISSQGKEICTGEQALLTLDKEYNASSYLWEWSEDGGLTWEAISTSKSALKEITKDGMARCTMDGLETAPISLKTITCCVVNGMPASRKTVFNETFGYFKDEDTYVDKDGNEGLRDSDIPYRTNTSFNIPQHTYDGSGQVNDGTYAVVVPTPQGYCVDAICQNKATWMNGVVTDHTSAIDGNANGGALFINVTANYKGIIFQSPIDGLCANKELTFETYIANLSGGENPFVSIYIKSLDGSKTYGEKENVVATAGGGWIKVSIDKILTPDQSVMLEVWADCGTQCSNGNYWQKGNDLAIDDIKFMTCSPPSISIYSDLVKFTQDTLICSDATIKMQAPTSELLLNYFGGADKTKFIYQVSVDGGTTWANLTGATDKAYHDFFTEEYPEYEKILVRVIVGSASAIASFEENPNAVVTGDDCSDYSTSDPFIITRVGDINMGKDYSSSACKGAEIILPGVDNEDLVSWLWQDAGGENLSELGSADAPKELNFTLNEDATIFFVGYTADGCVGKRKYILTTNPTAEITLSVDSLCDSTIVSAETVPATANIVWSVNGEESADFTGSELVIKEEVGEISATASAEGYCVSLPTEGILIGAKKSPGKPTTSVLDLVSGTGSASIEAAVSEEPGLTLEWVETSSLSSALPSSGWSETTPTVDISTEKTFYFFVRQKNEDGCVSDTSHVIVNVLSSPPPTKSDTTVCVGSVVTMEKLVSINAKTEEETANYEIVWYEKEDSDPSTGSIAAPAALTTTPSLQTWYVSQRTKTEPIVESKKVPVSVTTIGVKEPTVTTPVEYCKGEEASALTAKKFEIIDSYYYADGFMWKGPEDADYSATAPTPGTAAAGEAVYSVYQTCEIKGKAGTVIQTCEGEPVNITVKVYETEAPKEATVQYIKADATSNTFPAITAATTGAWVPEDGFEYYYSAISEEKTQPDVSTYTTTVPVPTYDVSSLGGGTKELYCWVYRISEANGKDCASEAVMITIKISDALPPSADNAYVCEDGAFPVLSAKANILEGSGKSADDYEIRWYENDPSAQSNPTPDGTGNTYDPKVSKAVADGGKKKEYYRYVTQYDKTTDAESSPTKVTITVWPKPAWELTDGDPAATCEKAVDISAAGSVTNAADCATPIDYKYVNEEGKEVDAVTSLTGAYEVTPSYSLPEADGVILSEDRVCAGTPATVNVRVDSLSVPVISGTNTVCPSEENVRLSVDTKDAVIKPAVGVTYTWGGDESGNGASIVLSKFSATKGDTYTYTVTAKTQGGVCEKESKTHTITVGEGVKDGTLTVTEERNSLLELGEVFEDGEPCEVYTCGGEVTFAADFQKDENSEYTWYEINGNNATELGTGGSYTLPASQLYGVKEYALRYSNKCDVDIRMLVHNVPVSVTFDRKDEVLCEESSFTKRVEVTCGEPAAIQWMLGSDEDDMSDRTAISGATQNIYTKSGIIESIDEGVYSCVVTNRGCKVDTIVSVLDVQRYIKVTPKTAPYIVIRGEQADMEVDIEVPESGEPAYVGWATEEKDTVNKAKKYTIAAVDESHDYTIVLKDPDYCPTTTKIQLLVDAKLQLKAELSDTLCLGSGDDLVVDTTGTGEFHRSDIRHSLTITRSMGGSNLDISGDFKSNGEELVHKALPTENATYRILYTYGDQKIDTTLSVTVIPSISLSLPDVPTVCEGESVDLEVSDIQPDGTTVSWQADPTITSALDSEKITAVPAYSAAGGTNHQSEYTYVAIAYNEFCKKSEQYEVKVKVDEPITGEITGSDRICEGASGRIDASKYAASQYLWTANGEEVGASPSMSVKPTETTVYTLDMTRGKCAASDEYTMEVTSLPVIVSVDSIDVRTREIITEEGKGTRPFTYWVDKESAKTKEPVIYDLAFSKHVAYVRDDNGCEAQYNFVMEAPQIFIPIYFSPNGDGINDTWTIGNVTEVYPNAHIQIFDRFGKLIVDMTGEENSWDGTYNGYNLPSTDYWYVVDIEEIDMQYNGHFTLIRQ